MECEPKKRYFDHIPFDLQHLGPNPRVFQMECASHPIWNVASHSICNVTTHSI